jgi:hypothetical protein
MSVPSLDWVSLPGPRHHLSVTRRLWSAHHLRGLAVPTSLYWRRFLWVRRFLTACSVCTSTQSLFYLILELHLISLAWVVLKRPVLLSMLPKCLILLELPVAEWLLIRCPIKSHLRLLGECFQPPLSSWKARGSMSFLV